MKLFVYGTKKKGFWNHKYLRRAQGAPAVAYDTRVFNPYGMPVMIPYKDSQTKGELYNTDEKTLTILDKLEGAPRFFRRSECLVQAEGETYKTFAWAYFYQGDIAYPPCPNGEWGEAFKGYFNPHRDSINELAEAL